jgi:hypothetical protein
MQNREDGAEGAAMAEELKLRPVCETNLSRLEAKAKALRPLFASGQRTAPLVVTFKMQDLNEILRCYGRGVAEGEWRDYALDFMSDRAVLFILRRSSETPIYQIVNDPALTNRQGAYLVSSNGRILRRGYGLPRVLFVLDRLVRLVLK